VSEVESRLRVVKEGLQTRADRFQILKVPEFFRQPSSVFTPKAWPFGLHNRENLVTTGPEEVKLAVVALFGLDEQSAWISFCNDIVPDPMQMLACYGLRAEAMNLKTDEIQRVLAFDALFLAVYIEVGCYSIDFALEDRSIWSPEHIRMSDEAVDNFFSACKAWTQIVNCDLCKVENQVPFDLIKKAIKHIQRRANPQYEHEGHPDPRDDRWYVGGQEPDPYLEKWMKEAVWTVVNKFMDISDDFFEREKEKGRLSESHHILDAAHKAICGVNGIRRTSDDTLRGYMFHIPPARWLKESGIKIQGVVGPLCNMSYNKHTKCLTLPRMKIFEETVAFVRNMARYEQYSDSNSCMFHDYVLLMLDLIQTQEDLTILTYCGVINNGSGIEGFELWKALDQGLLLRDSSTEHNQMKRDINSRCKLRRYRLWWKLSMLTKRALVTSLSVGTLVTVATLIQTYVAVVGSNGMKP
jgi:hypothetical protein